MYGLSPDVVKPGCTLHELICHRKATGGFTGDIEQYCADIRTAVIQKKTLSRVRNTTKRPFNHVINQPLETGGWMATHEEFQSDGTPSRN